VQRFLLKKGDKSTAGGVVLEGEERCMHHGTALTYIGAKVYCHTCKTAGFIVAKGPRWPDHMMGKEQALEGDICVCKCDPPPVMIASQRDSSHTFTASNLASMGYTSDGRPLQKQPSSTHWIRFSLDEPGSCEGLRCRAHFADGSTEEGWFDSNNRVYFDRPNTAICQKVEVVFDRAYTSGESAMGSILTAMGI
jgi:uncharacterized Zn-binding protein involved in type VI secretion